MSNLIQMSKFNVRIYRMTVKCQDLKRKRRKEKSKYDNNGVARNMYA